MAYYGWIAAAHHHLEWTDWCRLDNFVMTLTAIRRTQLRYNVNRAEISQILRDLPFESGIVSEHSRFPDALMINMTNSVLADIYQRIIGCCDIVFNAEHGLDRREFDNTRLALTTSVARALEVLSTHAGDRGCPFGFYSRESFERWHALVWADDSENVDENQQQNVGAPAQQ